MIQNRTDSNCSLKRAVLRALLAITLSCLPSVHAEQSIIRLPISIAIEDLADILTREIPDTFEWQSDKQPCTDGWRLPVGDIPLIPAIDCTAVVLVQLDKSPEVTSEGGSIRVSLPLTANVAVRGSGLLGRLTSLDTKLNAELNLSLLPSIAEDWSVQSGLTMAVDWQTEPMVRVGDFFELPARTFLDRFIEKQEPALRAKLDAELNEAGLKQMLSDGWVAVQEPVLLSDDPPAFLMVRPGSIALGPLITEQNQLRITTHIGARLSVSTEPYTSLPVLALPAPEALPEQDEQTQLNIAIQIPLNQASMEISSLVGLPRNEPLRFDDEVIAELHSEEIFMQSDDESTITALLAGRIHVTGSESTDDDVPVRLGIRFSPVLNEDARRISAGDLESWLEAGSDGESDALYQLLFSDVQTLITRHDGLPYDRLFNDELTGFLNAKVHNIALSDQVRLEVVPDPWSLTHLNVENNALAAMITLGGHLTLEVEQ